MKKLFTLSLAISCALMINAQLTESGNGFLETFDYEDGTVIDDVTYEGLSSEWPEESSVMTGVLTWDQGDEAEAWLGFGFENPMDVTGYEDFQFMYQLPAETAVCIYLADEDGGESEICPEDLFLGTSELMSKTIDLSEAEGLDITKIIEVGFLLWTPAAGTLYIDDILIGDAEIGATSIRNQSVINDMLVYPNPATTDLFLSMDAGSVSIINTVGQVVLSEINYKEGSLIDVSNLTSGIYFVKADNSIQKLLIK